MPKDKKSKEIKMKIEYKTNYNGYIPVLRAIQYLLKKKIITISQLGYYICFVSQADFDNRHLNYAVILRDDKELAKEWHCDISTIYRNRRLLINKGLLEQKNGLTLVTNYHAFELEWVKIFAKLPPATLQSLFIIPQEEIANNPIVIAQMQKNQPQTSTQSSNNSSKGQLGVSNFEDIDIDEISEEIEGEESK